MKCAADFRAIARNALRGRWPIAVVTGFVASLMGASIVSGGGSGGGDSYGDVLKQAQSTETWPVIRSFVFIAILMLLVWVIITLIISGAGKMGYATFNLKLVDKKDVSFSDLFSQFHRLGDGFCMNFLTGLYTLLWSLLFIIPGIIKMYSYAMTPYILAEHPGMTATESITQSKQMMEGNKWRLFCLEFSFIGWAILTALTLGIGSLWLVPYMQTAYASFYRELNPRTVRTWAVNDACGDDGRFLGGYPELP